MKPETKQMESRREFLKSAVRYTLLGGAAALAYALTFRRSGSSSNCIKKGLCQGCAALRDCTLPEAQSTRAKTT